MKDSTRHIYNLVANMKAATRELEELAEWNEKDNSAALTVTFEVCEVLQRVDCNPVPLLRAALSERLSPDV